MLPLTCLQRWHSLLLPSDLSTAECTHLPIYSDGAAAHIRGSAEDGPAVHSKVTQSTRAMEWLRKRQFESSIVMSKLMCFIYNFSYHFPSIIPLKYFCSSFLFFFFLIFLFSCLLLVFFFCVCGFFLIIVEKKRNVVSVKGGKD